MLEINSITVGYGTKIILDKLSLSVNPGSIHGILGKNGAGKTTLFKSIYGQLKKISGAVLWHGTPIQSDHIGFLETQNYFYSYITGKEYLKLLSTNTLTEQEHIWSDLFQLPLDLPIDQYSTGMKKKLALQGLLLQNRPILILDEPFNGVDLESSELIYRILKKLKEQGKTILIASHILETLTRSCTQISFLEEGKFQKTYEETEFHEMELQLRQLLSARIDPLLDQIFQ